MDEIEIIRKNKDRLRIFLIIYFFSNNHTDENKPHLKKILTAETKIQKIDFLLRSPDYLAYVLLEIAKSDVSKKSEIKEIVKSILQSEEPTFRRLDMEKFFYGAFEDLDDTIAFLKGVGFIEFSSIKRTDLTTADKKYYVTELAISKVNNHLTSLPALQWYVERCELIERFFGNRTGAELSRMQYEIEEYRDTTWGDIIESIQEKVESEYFELYGETL